LNHQAVQGCSVTISCALQSQHVWHVCTVNGGTWPLGVGNPMRRGFLIAFSGIDGSGKTTQIKTLEAQLRATNPRVVRIWSRWRPILSLPLLAWFIRRGYAEVHPTSSIGFVETHLPWKTGIPSLWCLLVQIDNFLKTTLKLAVPLLLGYTIILDRYTLDL